MVGRKFEGVIGGKILFGKERSSALDSEPVFLRSVLDAWGYKYDETEFEEIVKRSRAAVAASHGRGFITLDEFRLIVDSVLEV